MPGLRNAGGMGGIQSNGNVPNRHSFAWVCAVETLKVARARHEKDRVFDVVVCVARWGLGRWVQLPGLRDEDSVIPKIGKAG